METPPEPQSVGSMEVGPSSSRGAAAYLRLATVEQLIILLREPRYREEVIVLLDKCVANHPDTRMNFIKAKIPIYLYPFLKMKEVETPYAFLKLASLGVIGGLLKVAAFILSKILIQEEGLHYCCDYVERCYTVGRLLAGIIEKVSKPKVRQLKHVINCFLRMSDEPRACDALRHCFPAKLSDSSFINVLNQEDPSTMALLQQLIYKLTAVTKVSVDANWGAGLAFPPTAPVESATLSMYKKA
ncbi:hypothetical protein RJ640_026109 [Escallonia rubra]|uniref:Uncharacterized protein n=1 Tax=Escallonia rubra TaxID=112253 RepID=A0AA88RGL6_9ASTE|nr:hypothetical protein RJ640_026109 [Escallonia rubra]